MARLLLAVLACACCALAVIEAKVASPGEAESYLRSFGYMADNNPNPNMVRLMAEDPAAAMQLATRQFQRMAGLNMTGELDDATMVMMNMPRCGMKDMQSRTTARKRRRRYAISGLKWQNNHLTYNIRSFSNDLSQRRQEDVMKKAFKVWSDVTPLTFTDSRRGSADIQISFARGPHGDGNAFDGRGRTLAHAYFPGRGIGGDAHFDEDEAFTDGSNYGTNLFQVAAHEFGHSLGMEHSSDYMALMAPFYRGYQADFQLHTDDIRGIQAIYGRPSTSYTTTTTRAPRRRTTPSGGDYDICTDPTFEAAAAYASIYGTAAYAFKGNQVIRISGEGAPSAEPMEGSMFNEDGRGPSRDIDAALYWPSSHVKRNGERRVAPERTYLFKDDSVWRYDDFGLVNGYPIKISDGFPGIPDNLDGAFRLPGNGYTYFFKGSLYWRYVREEGVDSGYPRRITNAWRDIPADIDGAFQLGYGQTYFLKGNSLLHRDEHAQVRTFSLSAALGCTNEPGSLIGMNMDDTAFTEVDGEMAQTTTTAADDDGGVNAGQTQFAAGAPTLAVVVLVSCLLL